jgi:hypothetical protein
LNIDKYGERAIHSISSLKRYASKTFTHSLKVEERKKRIQSLSDYLDRFYPQFQVGLADIEPEVEIAIKSTEFAIMRGTARELSNHPETIVCGPSYLFWDDDITVVTYFLDFEKEWAKLEEVGRTEKKTVKSILSDIIAQK